MAFFFGSKKSKNPSELVKQTRDALSQMEKSKGNSKSMEKASESVSQNLVQMKSILIGDVGNEPNAELTESLTKEMYSTDCVALLIHHLADLEFEAKKDVVAIFSNILRRQSGVRYPTVDYICKNTQVLDELIVGYEDGDIALNCGSMLRECIRHDSLAKIILYSESFYKFFKYVEISNFDVASDAFATFKELLTARKALASEFLEKNYDQVFEAYTKLLTSENYVTRRQSLKLLGELLLDRANFNVMTRYISDAENLKLMMRMLRDKSKSIQYEAFHVFKVFVANPNKAEPILYILIKNKEKLISFLNNFHNDKDEEQFNDEKAYLLKQIQALGT
mmetsp:Transcript_13958/g.39684  ORF Transcript_13958/g.39684 Transcript_13958/m.39684 type:complete len:336 (+) Transcript_13958:84-1091(+)|eukprot:CAMPEP_0119133068 /NCGR_PEP_ID=MMETSP1310-20130426/12924_1 /TAXON_ID=464262 /ORGANISM="Genus nov. species nov., Strain RCC2339" /LENGTH=335 /DNA_ID=CAMNT_0007123741 /DNA_START=80 /DNA_END=1087 /DNA_ORIENTATION=+